MRYDCIISITDEKTPQFISEYQVVTKYYFENASLIIIQ